MPRFGLEIALDTNPIARGGRLAEGLYISDSSGTQTYYGSGTDFEGVTFASSYDVYWFEVDAEGDETTPVAIAGNVLALGENAPISVVGSGTYTAISLVMYRADTLTIDQSSGVAIGGAPALTASISGGAWSSDSADSITNISFLGFPYTEGDNTAFAMQTDPNGDNLQSTAITVTYFASAPIVEIDGQDITTDIVTSKYEADVVYLYGGSLVEYGGVQVTHIGEVAYYGGTLITVTDYALLPSYNNVQIVGLTDDFGTAFSTTTELCEKIPDVSYQGLTTIDEETYGTTYPALNTIDVDVGAPYEQLLQTPTEAPYTFTSGDWRDYNKTASYTYAGTASTGSEAIVITYKEQGLPEIDDKLESWTTDIFRLNNASNLYENTHSTGTAILSSQDALALSGTEKDIIYDSSDAQLFSGDKPTIESGPIVWDNAIYSTNMGDNFQPESTWTNFMYWDGYSFGSNHLMGRAGSDSSTWTCLKLNGTNIDVYVGGTVQASVASRADSQYNVAIWKNWNNGTNWVDSLFINGVWVYEERSTNRGTNVSVLNPSWGARFDVASHVDPSTDAVTDYDVRPSNIIVSDQALTNEECRAIYMRNTKRYLVAWYGDSICNGYGATGNTGWYDLVRSESATRGHDTEYIEYGNNGWRVYQYGPITLEDGYKNKPDWVPTPDYRDVGDADNNIEHIIEDVIPNGLICALTGLNSMNPTYPWVEKNPDAGVLPNPDGYGYDSYADEWVYKHHQAIDFAKNRGVFTVINLPTPHNDTSPVGEDNVPDRDVHPLVSGLIVDNSEFDYMVEHFSTLSEPDNTWTPAKTVDGLHPSDAGYRDMADNLEVVLWPIMDQVL